MRSTAFTVLTVLTVACSACEPGGTARETKANYTQQFFEPEYHVELSRTQVLYLPVYSNVLTSERARPTELAAILSIRNTDRESPIFVTSVTYYDTAGQLIETFLEGIYGLGPIASASIVIDVADTRGGLGPNFIVEWGAAVPVSDPVVETIMIGSSGTHGFSFISPARVIKSNDQ